MRLMYVTRRPAGHPPAQQYDSRMAAGGPAGLGPTIVAESRWQVSILFSRKAARQACLARGWRF
jgi:hypothetical protein